VKVFGRICLATSVALAQAALAHPEEVRTAVTLEIQDARLEARLTLVGGRSGQPIRSARVELQILSPSPELQELLRESGGILARTGNDELPGELLARAAFAEAPGPIYTATLPEPPPGRYAVVIVDTTYAGELALTATAVEFPLPGVPIMIYGLLPATRTPLAYLYLALLGLIVPAAIAIAAMLGGGKAKAPKALQS
jgi:hypothetical protein